MSGRRGGVGVFCEGSLEPSWAAVDSADLLEDASSAKNTLGGRNSMGERRWLTGAPITRPVFLPVRRNEGILVEFLGLLLLVGEDTGVG